MVRWMLGALLAAAVSIAGCEWNEYEVELRPAGDALTRDLTAWRDSANKSAPPGEEPSGVRELRAAELKRIAKAYDQKTLVAENKKHRFSGTFRGKLPNDLGGSGTFTRYASPLGDLCLYLERVRGSDDLVGDLDARRAALDRVFDIVIGWLDRELKDDPVAPKLHAWLDGPVRRDAANLLVDVWSTMAAHRNGAAPMEEFGHLELGSLAASEQDLCARLAQYLVDHDYLTPAEAPLAVRAFAESFDHGSQTKLLEFARKVAMRKLAIDDPAALDRVVASLGDRRGVEASLREFMRTTPEYAEAVRRAKQRAAEHNTSDNVSPEDAFLELLHRATLPPDAVAPRDRLRTKLHVPIEPLATNGDWDAEAKVVSWARPIDPAAAERAGMPLQLYAAWTEPNEAAQIRQFGQVILRGAPLAKYAFWHRCLSDDERRVWDGFLTQLRPGEDMQAKIEAFRFHADAGRKDGDLAQVAREALLEALGKQGIR